MSDFGAVYEYALQLEASIPAGTMAELEAVRPAVMGMTKRQTEEAEKLAAMEPEDRAKAEVEIAVKREEARAKAEAEIAVKREEARAKAEETMRKRAAEAASPPAPHPAPVAHPATPAANNKR